MKFKTILILFVISLSFNLLLASIYLSDRRSTKPLPVTPTPTVKPVLSPTPPSISEESELTSTGSSLAAKLTPPANFGFTKLIDLPGIGVRAKFPSDVEIKYSEPNSSYQVSRTITRQGKQIPAYIDFSLSAYSGSSRRQWFQNRYGNNFTFQPFNNQNQSGYLAIGKDSYSQHYYFALKNPQQIIVITGFSDFFNNLDSFKSFISTVGFLAPNPTSISRADQQPAASDMLKTSGNRKTIWQNDEYGIKISVPETIEYRVVTDWTDLSNMAYSEWRKYDSFSVNPIQNYNNNIFSSAISLPGMGGIGSPSFGGDIFFFLPQYQQLSPESAVKTTLLGAGFCSYEFKETKSSCQDPTFCYTKSEVQNSFYLKNQKSFAGMAGYQWAIKADFDSKNDCRSSEQTYWIVKGKNSKIFATTIDPSDLVLKFE